MALLGDPSEGATVSSVANVVVALGLGIAAVLLIPIQRPWLRWIVNPVILVIPMLVALELFAG